MNIASIIQISTFAWFVTASQRFGFFEFPARSSRGPWDDQNHQRNLSDDNCECGLDDSKPGKDKPWQIFVLATLEDELLCTGTIITSNLLVTSHACLQLANRRYNVYDAWFPKSDKGRNVHQPTSYAVSRYSNDAVRTPFSVVGVFFNYRHGVNLATRSDPGDDLVLFQVEPHFSAYPSLKLRPICLPTLSDLTNNLVSQKAYYLGPMAASSKGGGRFWNFEETCLGIKPSSTTSSATTTTTTPTTTRKSTTTTDRSLSSGELSTKTNPPDKNFGGTPSKQNLTDNSGQIVVIDMCDKNADDLGSTAEENFICFKGDTNIKPKFGDGALVIHSTRKFRRNFLVGLGAFKPSGSGKTRGLVQFTNVSSLIKYIEYHASKANSSWCRSENLTLPNPKARHREQSKVDADHISVAAESTDELNCVCGIPNNERETDAPRAGRATPGEFPWMMVIRTKSIDRWCSGFLVNDRMVLTSMGCIQNVGADVNNDNVEVFLDYKGAVRQHFKIKKYDVHKEYYTDSKYRYLHDIVVILLDGTVDFGSCEKPTVRPICLPPNTNGWHVPRSNDRTAVVVGMGKERFFVTFGFRGNYIDWNASPAAYLNQRGYLRILWTDCRDARQLHQSTGVFQDVLCAAAKINDLNKNPIYWGGKGSPLSLVLGRHNQWVAVGIGNEEFQLMSRAFADFFVSYYTNIHYHRDFIYAKAKEYQAKWCQSIIN